MLWYGAFKVYLFLYFHHSMDRFLFLTGVVIVILTGVGGGGGGGG